MAVFTGASREEVASDSDDGGYESYADLRSQGVLDAHQQQTVDAKPHQKTRKSYENVNPDGKPVDATEDGLACDTSPQLVPRGARPKFYSEWTLEEEEEEGSSGSTDYTNSSCSVTDSQQAQVVPAQRDIADRLRETLNELHRNGAPNARRFSQGDALNARDVTSASVDGDRRQTAAQASSSKKTKVKLKTKLKQKLARKSYSFEKQTPDCFDDVTLICDFEPLDQPGASASSEEP